jgi:hypothetical protein
LEYAIAPTGNQVRVGKVGVTPSVGVRRLRRCRRLEPTE